MNIPVVCIHQYTTVEDQREEITWSGSDSDAAAVTLVMT